MYDRATSLARLVDQVLGVPLAEKKICCAGSSKAITDARLTSMGKLAGRPEIAARNLGVDYAPGRHRRQLGHGRVRRK
eukprot:205365-Pyramimonas_sp.AAC.2